MREVDLATWNRREIYQHFSKIDYPFYSVTLPVEVTGLKAHAQAKKLSFYHMMIWACTKALNEVPAFRQRIRGDKVVEFVETHPSFTTMKPGEDSFIIITPDWNPELEVFCARASQLTQSQTTLFGENKDTDQLIYFSCTPWFDFTALTNERNFDPADTVPRIAWGKYYQEGEKLFVHLSIDVNHRTIDGYHIGQFMANLEEIIGTLSPALSN